MAALHTLTGTRDQLELELSRPCLQVGLLWDGGNSRPTRMYFASCGFELCLNLEAASATIQVLQLEVLLLVLAHWQFNFKLKFAAGPGRPQADAAAGLPVPLS
jgi:hypothetical protein